ncbi:MAG TPA: sulfatase-like hydrolase/transferase, partial [Rhodocyclaceae bacterium]|nr:sulfatase-like hydrolase/transferase [Rhodocyclaceae bacterium]
MSALMTTWRAFWARFSLRSETLILLVTLFLMTTANTNFWRTLLAQRSFSEFGTWRFLIAIFIALTALHFLAIGIFAIGRGLRIVLSVLVVLSTITAYHMQHYGIVLDPTMVRNVLHTDWHEARELLNADMFVYLLLAVVPVIFVWSINLQARTFRRALVARLISLGVALLVGVGALLFAYQDFGSAMRTQKGIRYMLTPGNVIWSLARVATDDLRAASRVRDPAEPAQRVLAPDAKRKPTLLVLVVGETARAANFGLTGYTRMNTPELAKLDVITFPHTTSCGTSTEVSVPCMFSPYGRANYDEDKIRNHESLLHLVDRAGVKVSWLDNQSGCKGVCDGLDFVDIGQHQNAELCSEGHCFDEILLKNLQQKLTGAPQDRFVVLHQLGNHGPAYFRRYPDAFKRYMPACENNDLGKCSQEQIVNAYDNAISYTDHVLAQTIAYLKTQ